MKRVPIPSQAEGTEDPLEGVETRRQTRKVKV